jgi:DNA-binding transcriptional regulator GbsR (MarR family)
MPMQCPLMMESLASRPGASKSEIAVALKELTQQIVTQAHQRGAGEIYFLGTDVDTDVMACNQIFERVDYPVYRVRLKDLENQP